MEEKEFPAKVEAYPEVSTWVEDKLTEYGCPMKILLQISMCLEEAFINIAHYAYPGGSGTMHLGWSFRDGEALLRLRDRGIAFNPLAKEDPDTSMGVEERQVGGLGIFLVKEMMDKVTYERKNGENILSFSKKIRV